MEAGRENAHYVVDMEEEDLAEEDIRVLYPVEHVALVAA